MKKLIHLGMFAIFALTVSSCSKSTNDTIAKEKETPALPKHDINPILPEDAGTDGSSIFQFINQPISLKLGDANHNLSPGATAVFYVRFADGFGINSASAATLTTKDYNTGGDIQSYNLISCDDIDLYDVQAPDDLVGKRFMFAIVELDGQYTDKTISLFSDITVDGINTLAQLDHSFTVSYYVNR
ncbi:MAG TPA: hypothetical protein VK483_06995 [Chitinophagaceae bacterium]|nr:hypothetical protein [Chitinophagaceae bacterium]